LRYAFNAEPLGEYGLIEGNDPCVKSAEAVEQLAQRNKLARVYKLSGEKAV